MTAGEAGSRRGVLVFRHALPVRLWHWLNALAIFVMIGSGANIFNAHPRLYLGSFGAAPDRPVAEVYSTSDPVAPRGFVRVGPVTVDTTGFLGVSAHRGAPERIGFPDWMTLPGRRDLADARRWHFLFAWVLIANVSAFGLWSLARGHLRRDLWPTLADLRSAPRSIVEHLRLHHPTGQDALRYNPLQKFAYLGVLALIGLMIATGFALSPGMDAAIPGLPDLFGGRQSARTVHFVCASLILAFIFVHLVMVVLTGPINEIGSMITGRFRVPPEPVQETAQ